MQTNITLSDLVKKDLSLQSVNESDLSTQEISYHELAINPIQQVDQLQALSRNIEMLSQTVARLKFMNREIRYLMKV